MLTFKTIIFQFSQSYESFAFMKATIFEIKTCTHYISAESAGSRTYSYQREEQIGINGINTFESQHPMSIDFFRDTFLQR